MKWLFAILVALNIVVFGCMVAGKLVLGPSATPKATASSEVEIVAPAIPDISVRNASMTNNNNNQSDNNAVNPPKPPVIKTEATPNSQPKAESKTDSATPATSASVNCSATVTLPENDFHRIKGLLRQWPYSAKRLVEQITPSAKSNRVSRPTRYMVTLNNIDEDTRKRLQEHGFDYGTAQGKISLGIFNRREDAESLMVRAKMKGFSEASVSTLESSNSDDTANTATSIAKMRVTFTGVDNSAIQDINKITGRYGQIQRSGSCH